MSDEGTPQSSASAHEADSVRPEIQQAIKSVAPELTPEKRERLLMAVAQVSYMGPIPPPEMLQKYAETIPDAGDRILKMAEAQAAHRIATEKLVIGSQQVMARRGQCFALVIALAGFALTAYVTVHGFPWVGGIVGGSTLVALVIAFISGRQQQIADLERKRPEPPGGRPTPRASVREKRPPS